MTQFHEPPYHGQITPANWLPLEVTELGPAIDDAIRDPGNVIVVAGPGAGKTEFLAQRAAYLLQTGLCRPPQRILAISFKRESAANLARRVATRLPNHPGRLTSVTFDSFTKGLLDRFRAALPPAWALRPDYRIFFPTSTYNYMSDFVSHAAEGAPAHLQHSIYATNHDRFLPDILGTRRLDAEPSWPSTTAEDVLTGRWWQDHFFQPDPQMLEFTMVNRLAELLVRIHPQITRALRQTFPFVFVDEFQDTTAAQFGFMHAVFGSYATITAVGDRKQRIMGFAGALPDAFDRFINEIGGTRHDAQWNFRSSEALVELQHIIASRLDANVIAQISKAPVEEREAPIRIWTFDDAEREASKLAEVIANDIETSSRTAADFAVLGRQKVGKWEQRLTEHLGRHGIRLRNEDHRYGHYALQDLLKHEVTRYVLGMLTLAAHPKGHGQVWLDTLGLLQRIRGVDDAQGPGLSDELALAVVELRAWQAGHPPSAAATLDDARSVIGRTLGTTAGDVDAFVRAQHRGEEATSLIDSLALRLLDAIRSEKDWAGVVEAAEARDAVSLLTAHKSKGLEYHTVFFVGMDNDSWWAHGKDPDESISTFFVGLSRAAQRIVFTAVGHSTDQIRIADLFAMLTEAGVPETHWR